MSSFVRRASSSSIIPLSIRSIVSQISFQRQISLLNVENSFAVGARFLPFVRFSTRPLKEICSQLESYNVNYSSNSSLNVIRTSDAFPFDIEDNNGSLRLVKNGLHEKIELDFRGDTYEVSKGNPKISMIARITTGLMLVEFEAAVEPDVISIHSLKARKTDFLAHMSHFEDYIYAKGIDGRLLDSLLNYFGKQPRLPHVASDTSENLCDHDGFGFHGLSFDIKAGGLEEGNLTLTKKSPDEIIEVKVRPYYEALYSRPIDAKSPQTVVGYKLRQLYMLVKIYSGELNSKCQNFFIFADKDGYQIRMMTMRCFPTKIHLEEFEEYFKERGITPSNTNCLFDYFKSCNKSPTPSHHIV